MKCHVKPSKSDVENLHLLPTLLRLPVNEECKSIESTAKDWAEVNPWIYAVGAGAVYFTGTKAFPLRRRFHLGAQSVTLAFSSEPYLRAMSLEARTLLRWQPLALDATLFAQQKQTRWAAKLSVEDFSLRYVGNTRHPLRTLALYYNHDAWSAYAGLIDQEPQAGLAYKTKDLRFVAVATRTEVSVQLSGRF